MSKYWSASTNSIWCSNVCAVNQMPEDVVLLTDVEFAELMEKQAQGYRIVHNSSTGKPQAIAQSCGTCTYIPYVKTVNGNAPDSDGNITPAQTGCLPLTGGTMTGPIISKVSDFILRDVDTSGICLYSGSTPNSGAAFLAFGKDMQGVEGQFFSRASDGTNTVDLIGKPDGTLIWGEKNVERVNAIGSNYIRYESGLQICWNSGNYGGTGSQYTFTYPAAFSGSYPIYVNMAISNNNLSFAIAEVISTTFKQVLSGATSTNISWRYTAIGRWK